MGRPEETKHEELRDELVLEPSDTLTKKKQPMLVNMKQAPERPEVFAPKVSENQDELHIEPRYETIQPRVKGVLSLKKMTEREDFDAKQPTRDEVELNPNYDLVRKQVGTAVNIERGAQRFKDKPSEDIYDGRVTTDQQIDHVKALESTKPEKTTADFKRFAPRSNEEVKNQIEKRIEEARKKSPPKGPREIREELENNPNKNKRVVFLKPTKAPKEEEKKVASPQKSPADLGPWDQ